MAAAIALAGLHFATLLTVPHALVRPPSRAIPYRWLPRVEAKVARRQRRAALEIDSRTGLEKFGIGRTAALQPRRCDQAVQRGTSACGTQVMKGASTVNRGTAIGLLNMSMTAPQARNRS